MRILVKVKIFKNNIYSWLQKYPIPLSILGVLAVLVLYTVAIYWIKPTPPDKAGIFGDMFGAVTSFFTMLGFLGIAYTLFLTRRQIAQSEKEHQQNKDSLENQIQIAAMAAQLSATPIILEQEYNHLTTYHKKLLSTGNGSFHIPASMTNKHYEGWINKYKEENRRLDDNELCFLNNMKEILRLRKRLISINEKLESLSKEN